MIDDLLLDELIADDRRFALNHRGHVIVADIAGPGLLYSAVQVFVDNRRVGTKTLFATTRIPAELPAAGQVAVEVTVDLLGAVKSCSVIDETGEHPMQKLSPRAASRRTRRK